MEPEREDDEQEDDFGDHHGLDLGQVTERQGECLQQEAAGHERKAAEPHGAVEEITHQTVRVGAVFRGFFDTDSLQDDCEGVRRRGEQSENEHHASVIAECRTDDRPDVAFSQAN
jgi:hypothetical protein